MLLSLTPTYTCARWKISHLLPCTTDLCVFRHPPLPRFNHKVSSKRSLTKGDAQRLHMASMWAYVWVIVSVDSSDYPFVLSTTWAATWDAKFINSDWGFQTKVWVCGSISVWPINKPVFVQQGLSQLHSTLTAADTSSLDNQCDIMQLISKIMNNQ